MDFTSHDIAVIEQALQLAISTATMDSKVNHFREVLTKLQNKAGVPMHGTYLQSVSHDGLRYGYDDSSELL
jgi:hypothetical protein